MSQSLRDEYLAAMGIQVWVPRATPTDTGAHTEGMQDGIVVATDLPKITFETSAPLDNNEAPVFCIGSWCIPNQGLIIAEVSEVASGLLTNKEQSLLADILFALGIADEANIQPTYFRWPMIDSGQLDQSELVAKDALKAFINAQLAQFEPNFVLLFVELVAKYLTGLGGPDTVNPLLSNCSVIRCPSLASMLKEPPSKASTWSILATDLKLDG